MDTEAAAILLAMEKKHNIHPKETWLDERYMPCEDCYYEEATSYSYIIDTIYPCVHLRFVRSLVSEETQRQVKVILALENGRTGE